MPVEVLVDILSFPRVLPGASILSKVTSVQKQFYDNYEEVCRTGEKVLIIRHPILLLISAWNDKFNLNNTDDEVGLQFGAKLLLLPKMRTHFSRDSDFLVKELMVRTKVIKVLRV